MFTAQDARELERIESDKNPLPQQQQQIEDISLLDSVLGEIKRVSSDTSVTHALIDLETEILPIGSEIHNLRSSLHSRGFGTEVSNPYSVQSIRVNWGHVLPHASLPPLPEISCNASSSPIVSQWQSFCDIPNTIDAVYIRTKQVFEQWKARIKDLLDTQTECDEMIRTAITDHRHSCDFVVPRQSSIDTERCLSDVTKMKLLITSLEERKFRVTQISELGLSFSISWTQTNKSNDDKEVPKEEREQQPEKLFLNLVSQLRRLSPEQLIEYYEALLLKWATGDKDQDKQTLSYMLSQVRTFIAQHIKTE